MNIRPLMSPDGGASGGQSTSGTAAQSPTTASSVFGMADTTSQAGQQGDSSQGQGQGTTTQPAGQQAPAGSAQTATPPPAPPALTSEAIAQAMLQVQQAQGQQGQQQQRQYTQEDFDKAFNVWKPSKQHFQQLKRAMAAAEDDPTAEQEVLGILAEMAGGAARQGVTISAYHMQQQMEQLEQRLAPAIAFIQRAQEAELKQEFYAQHKDLVPYEAVVTMIVNQRQAKGQLAKTKEEAFKQVSEEARQIVQQLAKANGQGTQSAAAGTQQTHSTNRMSTVSAGGQSATAGAAGNAGNGKPKSAGLAVFQ